MQTEYEKVVLKKIKQLPPLYLKEVLDFMDFLTSKSPQNEALLLSEKSLAKDWLLPEEDEA